MRFVRTLAEIIQTDIDNMKKNKYSVPLKHYWKNFYGIQKKITPYFPDEIIFNILRQNILKSPIEADETIEKKELIITGLELWYQDAIGGFLHIYFLDKHLQSFLESTPLSDLDGICEYLMENGQNREIVYTKINSTKNCVNYSFGIHIPNENEGYAFSLNLFENNTIELYFNVGNNSGRTTDKFYRETKNSKDLKILEINKMFKLAINSLAYMKCFPECITDGPPKIDNDEYYTKSEKISLKLTNEIYDESVSKKSVIPHFRKGHFRLLKSDYYKNKKGNLIYIQETMVKAKAKTVSTSENLNKFNEEKKIS